MPREPPYILDKKQSVLWHGESQDYRRLAPIRLQPRTSANLSVEPGDYPSRPVETFIHSRYLNLGAGFPCKELADIAQ